MKSSSETLRKRGLPNETDIYKAQQLSTEDLYTKLLSFLPAERSAAAIALRERNIDKKECTLNLLQSLQFEKSLYARIEMCKTLETGDSDTAHLMCNYLGKIGNNQYLSVSETVSRKASYPLPRDIIARSLARMNTSVFPVLLERSEKVNRTQLSEIIDAIGFMAFYNQELAIASNFVPIIRMFEKHKMDDLLIWKITICCSAFPIRQSTDLLDKIIELTGNDTIIMEAHRSQKLLSRGASKKILPGQW